MREVHAPIYYFSEELVRVLHPLRYRVVALTTPRVCRYRTLSCPGGRVSIVLVFWLFKYLHIYHLYTIICWLLFQLYTVVVRNARRPGGHGPPLLDGPEYGSVIVITLTCELAQLQRTLRCSCHGVFCVVVVGDLSCLPFSIEVLGILPLDIASSNQIENWSDNYFN